MQEAKSFFDWLDARDLQWVLDHSQSRAVAAGQAIVVAGQQREALFFVSQGSFAVHGVGTDVWENHSARGAMIGEIAWMERGVATATVRAVEASEVLALPLAALEHQLASSPVTAARFRSALVRRMTTRSRCADRQSAATGLSSSGDEGIPEVLRQALADFKRSAIAADNWLLDSPDAIGQAEAELIPRLERLVNTFEGVMRAIADPDIRAMVGSVTQRELLPFMRMSEIFERSYSKPRGYAGDAQTIELMYRNQPSGIGRLGPVIDRACCALPATLAVRNRRELLKGLIAEALDRAPARIVRVTSLACGPAREVFDIFEGGDSLACEARERLHVTALDLDEEALSELRKRICASGLGSNITLVHANLVHVSIGRQVLAQLPQDLIYSIGLTDYFTDKAVVKLLDWVHGQLQPGGRCVLGNFSTDNPMRAFMDHVVEWRLIHRSPDDMDRLFQESRFSKRSTRMLFEEQEINLFAECER